MNMKKKNSGFTLVEIAIVLVIIGLLLGGVLKGQEMISNARIKKLESDFRGVSAAFYTYQDRFNKIPGDDTNAASRFSGTWDAGNDNGDGNGLIYYQWNSSTNSHESRKVWKHLRGAGLIAGPVTNDNESYQQPTHAYGGRLGIVGYHTPYYTTMGRNRIWVCFGNIDGDVATVLESRGDDDNAGTGSIISQNASGAYNIDSNYNPLCMKM
ncbi:MAG: prepilin-type N-terminal cleavage/methylation domain-containing protein [Gammaproteobacteria bacterium]|nr:MAG: prepilin-type N-terminal cleavage/methylation domain-containing protein [Gammaproteobacteria bacterium]